MKFDCNPKYTIPYVKVCDNVHLTQYFIYQLSFHMKAHTLLPIQVCLSFSGGLTTFSRSPPRVPYPLPTVHNTAVVTLQSYVFAFSFPSKSSLSFKLEQGSYALLGQQGTQGFLREKTFTFTLYAWQGHSAQNRKLSLIQVPGFSSSLYHYCHRYMKYNSLLHMYHP